MNHISIKLQRNKQNKVRMKREIGEAITHKIQVQSTSWELTTEERRHEGHGKTEGQRGTKAGSLDTPRALWGLLTGWTVGCLAGSWGQISACQDSSDGLRPRYPLPNKIQKEDLVQKITPIPGLPTVKPTSTAHHTKNLLAMTCTSLKSSCFTTCI